MKRNYFHFNKCNLENDDKAIFLITYITFVRLTTERFNLESQKALT
jgi:hypothetical protein